MQKKSKAQLVWPYLGKWRTSRLKSPIHQKGSLKKQLGFKVLQQTATVAFTARGLQKYSRTESAKIDETVEPYIVDSNGNKATFRF